MTRLEYAQNFATNVEKVRLELNLTQEEMARKLELSLSSYKRILKGDTLKIDVYTLIKLYELTDKLAYEFLGIEDEKLRIISLLNDLSRQQLLYISAVCELEKKFRVDNPTDCDDYITVFVPTGDMYDGMIYDTSVTEKLNVAKYRKLYGDRISFGVKITSHHLRPAYNLDDIILIAREPIRDGDIGLYYRVSDGKIYFRKYKHATLAELLPLNELGHPFYLDLSDEASSKEWVRLGKVISKVR